MADVLQKGISSISDLLYDHLGISVTDVSNNGDRLSKFIKYFARLKFKHDERFLAESEIEKSKLILNQPSLPLTKKYSELVLLSFLHNIGYDVSFSFIHAINLAQQGDVKTKRLGYLLCSLFFDENHQFALLLINTILKDLQNPNVANECAALVAASQLVAVGDLPTVLPYVRKHLGHRVAISRKKVLQCLCTFVSKEPSLIPQVEPHLLGCLKDGDPGVVWAAVEIYLVVVKYNPGSSYGFLVTPTRNMLEKIVDGKLPEVYSYHGNSYPWFLMSLLRLLVALLKRCPKSTEEVTEEVTPVLIKLLKQTKASHRIGFAILFEAVRAFSQLDSISDELFERSSECIRLFLSSHSFCLKLSGIRLVSMLILRRPSSALDFHSAILEVLSCPDPSLEHAAVNLLFVMANKSNKDFVCQKILEQTDKVGRARPCNFGVTGDVYQRLLNLANRFSEDDPVWFVKILFQVVEKAGRSEVRLDLDPRLLSGLQGDRVTTVNELDEQMLLAREKAIELAMEKLVEALKDPSGVCECLGVCLLSLQVLVEFQFESKFAPDEVVRILIKLLPAVIGDTLGHAVLSSTFALIDRVAMDTRVWIQESLDNLLMLDNRSLDGLSRLNLIELKILTSQTLDQNLGSNRGEFELESTLVAMERYAVHYLESGGSPYVKPGVDHARLEKLSRPTPRDYSCQGNEREDNPISKLSSIKEVTTGQDNLKFSSNISNSAWSISGYKQSVPRLTNLASNEEGSKSEDKEIDSLSRQLFQGF